MNDKYLIKIASKDEAFLAYNLSTEIFENSNETSSKYTCWNKVPENDEVIVIKCQGDVVGCIRISSIEVYVDGNFLKFANLTSICIKKTHQGQGLSTLLINYTLQHCSRCGYEYALVIARRAVDYYYLKYNFYAISTYDSLTIRSSINSKNLIDITLQVDTDFDINIANIMYHYSYSKSNGMVKRQESNWLNLKNIILGNQNYFFKWIISDNNKIGYIVYFADSIVEISIDTNFFKSTHLEMLAKLHNNFFTVPIDSKHRLMQHLNNIDYAVTKRSCPYGGHLIHCLGENNILKKDFSTKFDNSFNINQLDQF